MDQSGATDRELTEAEKLTNVIRLAFDNDPAKLDAFIQLIRKSIPGNTAVVLRGSAVTVSVSGQRAVRHRWSPSDHFPLLAEFDV
jgi:hypothetical protein